MAKNKSNSLVNRWASDKNPVRVSGKATKNKIEIRQVPDISKVLNKK